MAKNYWGNGKLSNEENWENGELNGVAKWYYENGQLATKANFKDSKLISAICWDEKGNKEECDDMFKED